VTTTVTKAPKKTNVLYVCPHHCPNLKTKEVTEDHPCIELEIGKPTPYNIGQVCRGYRWFGWYYHACTLWGGRAAMRAR